MKFEVGRQQKRFFSDLVGPREGLIDFESEVALVVVAVSLAFDDLDLVVDPFQFAGVDGVITVVEDPVPMPLQHLGELVQSAMFQRAGQGAPFIQGFAGPGSRSIGPDMFELVFQDHDGVNHLV